MRRSLSLLLLALLGPGLHAQPLAPASDAGAVEVRSETVYYEVHGETAEALGAALAAHGPRIDGQGFFGLTEWEVSASYRWAARATGCAVDHLTVRVAVKTHLPRWHAPADASPAVVAAWHRFVAALDLHEQGHGHLAEEAAFAVRSQLAALRVPDCARMKGAVQRTVAAVMRAYDAHNRVYDAETGHGRTQHAVWPSPLLAAEARRGEN